MDWDNGSCLKLIEKYKENKCLWDSRCEEYKSTRNREEAWKTIASVLNRDIGEVKKKMESLLASFRRERQRCLGPKKSEPADDYKPRWFAYNNMKFLLFKYKPRYIPSAIKMIDFDEQEDTTENEITVEEHHPSTSRIKKESPSPDWEEYQPSPQSIPIKRKIREDPWVNEAYKILKSAINYDKDGSAVFGEYVATKHRRYSAYTKSTVEHLINNILYNADIGKYDEPNGIHTE